MILNVRNYIDSIFDRMSGQQRLSATNAPHTQHPRPNKDLQLARVKLQVSVSFRNATKTTGDIPQIKIDRQLKKKLVKCAQIRSSKQRHMMSLRRSSLMAQHCVSCEILPTLFQASEGELPHGPMAFRFYTKLKHSRNISLTAFVV